MSWSRRLVAADQRFWDGYTRTTRAKAATLKYSLIFGLLAFFAVTMYIVVTLKKGKAARRGQEAGGRRA